MTSERPLRIALLSPQSNRNLGDTATFVAAIAAYRRRIPNVELIVVVPEPAESASLLGTAGFPLYGDGEFVPRGASAPEPQTLTTALQPPGRMTAVRRVYAFAAKLDAIVFTGGGLLDDFWGGSWTLPFWTLVWVAAARARGARVVFHAVGFDRLTKRASRFMALTAMRLAHYRSFRDDESRRLVEALGLRAPCDVVPDLAFALDSADVGTPAKSKVNAPYVIVNPVSERMWTHASDGSYSEYLDCFVDLARRLLDRGYGVKLLSTQDRMDADALDHVARKLQADARANWEQVRVTCLDAFMALAKHAELVVSSRLHGLILPVVAGTPVVSVAPMRKMSRVMADTGMGEFNIGLAELRRDALLTIVDRALVERAELRQRVNAIVSEYRRRLNLSFDHLVSSGLLGGSTEPSQRARPMSDAGQR